MECPECGKIKDNKYSCKSCGIILLASHPQEDFLAVEEVEEEPFERDDGGDEDQGLPGFA